MALLLALAVPPRGAQPQVQLRSALTTFVLASLTALLGLGSEEGQHLAQSFFLGLLKVRAVQAAELLRWSLYG